MAPELEKETRHQKFTQVYRQAGIEPTPNADIPPEDAEPASNAINDDLE